jgi:ketosteroid isomerase-like protein
METTPSEQSVISRIKALESQRYTAMIEKDLDAMGALLHDDLVYVHSSGVADTKDSYLDGILEGRWDYHNVERRNSRFVLAGDTVLLFCTLGIAITMSGEYRTFESRALIVWQSVNGTDWQLIGVQAAAGAAS